MLTRSQKKRKFSDIYVSMGISSVNEVLRQRMLLAKFSSVVVVV